MLNRLDLHEGRLSKSVYIPRTIAAELTSLNIATLVPTHEADRYDISNVRKVGAVIIDGTLVRIEPKTAVQRLFALLMYARSPETLWRGDSVSFDSDPDLYSTIAHAFGRALHTAIGGGLLKGYVVKEEALPLVRGRWRITDQLTRRAGHPLPLEVTYDDYIEDIIENRVLKAAARRLLNFPALPPTVRLSLRQSLRLLDDVTQLPAGSRPPEISITRVNVRYEGALLLANLILSDSSLEHREGTVVGSGFLIDLWTIFEDFVGTALGAALQRRGGRATTQYSSFLDVGHQVSIAPDLVWSESIDIDACVDIKYKVERHGRYPNADLYQLVAYCTRFGLDYGHLVYAAGGPVARRLTTVNGPVIYQHALDLDVPFLDLLIQLDAIAELIVGDTEPPSLAPIRQEATQLDGGPRT
jgi:5-methylcytosine-specific restriction enzyme subunit McrC